MVEHMDTPTRGINYWAAMIMGWVLVVIGVWGFVQEEILGIFDTSLLHNIIHLASGLVLLAAAYMNGGQYARTTNLTLGIVYALVAILGFATPAFLQSIIDFGYDENTNVLALADNWLHLGLAVVLTAVAFAERSTVTRPMSGATR